MAAARRRPSIRSGCTAASCAARSIWARRAMASSRCAPSAARSSRRSRSRSAPTPGPVHVKLPLRKPLEPAAAHDRRRARARSGSQASSRVTRGSPRRGSPDPGIAAELAAAIAREPDGVIVAGALPAGLSAARAAVLALATRAGYPLLAESGSQLRFGPRPDGVTFVGHFDLIPRRRAAGATPRDPARRRAGGGGVGRLRPQRLAAAGTERWVLAGPAWHDADSSARGVILGDVTAAIDAVAGALAAQLTAPRSPTGDAAQPWRAAEACAAHAIELALDRPPAQRGRDARARRSTRVPAGAAIQLGNSLPIRVDRSGVQRRRAADRAYPARRRGIDGLDRVGRRRHVRRAAGAARARRRQLRPRSRPACSPRAPRAPRWRSS